jgi:hypothetical protein
MDYYTSLEMKNLSTNDHELIGFIVEAKRNTDATGNGSKAVQSREGAKDFPYKKGSYSYLDSYFGELDFVGQEVVWQDRSAIWAMNYFGNTFEPVDGFPDFLFDCLKMVSDDAPFRGPKQHQNEVFEYICSWSGDLNQFHGEEKIIKKDKVSARV